MTGIPLNGKVIDYDQLKAEMAAAGVTVNGLGTAGGNVFTYDAQGEPIDLPAGAAAVLTAHVPSTALHDQMVAAMQSSVGVTLAALTQAQRLSLIVGLLYKAGAIDHTTMAVRPLNTWLL